MGNIEHCECGKPLSDTEQRMLLMAQDRDREIAVWKARLVEETARLRGINRGAVEALRAIAGGYTDDGGTWRHYGIGELKQVARDALDQLRGQ